MELIFAGINFRECPLVRENEFLGILRICIRGN